MNVFRKIRRSSSQTGSAEKKRSGLSRARDISVSALIVGILGVSILSSLPDSMIKITALPVLTPIARATGLDQSWGMFAPNPPTTNSAIEIHVIMANGADKVWRPYDDDGMRQMQWRKFKEDVLGRAEYRPGLALWAIRHVVEKGDRPVRVVMVAEFKSIPLPGGTSKTTQKVLLDKRIPASLTEAQK
jgi:hypothetical protein